MFARSTMGILVAWGMTMMVSGCVVGPPDDGEWDDPSWEMPLDDEGDEHRTGGLPLMERTETSPESYVSGNGDQSGKSDQPGPIDRPGPGLPEHFEDDPAAQGCGDADLSAAAAARCHDSAGGDGVGHGSPQPLDPSPTNTDDPTETEEE